MSAVISWSAGKDSCLAGLLARENGLNITTYLTMLDCDGLSKSHALPRWLIDRQVQALDGRWWPVSAGSGEYGRVFDEQLTLLRAAGHTHMVFGDIDLQAHRDWLEPACRRAGLFAVFPLWGLLRSQVAAAILARGIRAQLVCVDARWLDASFCGAEYNLDLLARLPPGTCPCGENGEFHSFVWDAPGFAAPLQITPGAVRRVASKPPLTPTDLFCQVPLLMEADGAPCPHTNEVT